MEDEDREFFDKLGTDPLPPDRDRLRFKVYESLYGRSWPTVRGCHGEVFLLPGVTIGLDMGKGESWAG